MDGLKLALGDTEGVVDGLELRLGNSDGEEDGRKLRLGLKDGCDDTEGVLDGSLSSESTLVSEIMLGKPDGAVDG